MKTVTKFKLIGWICIGLLMWQGAASLGSVSAQDPAPTPRPTPGGSGGGSGSGGSSSDSSGMSVPLAPKTGLEGFVYNYSSGANQPGITVVVKGEGWQGEATTDSNGYYQIVELGFGNAVANVQLPANGPKAAAENWPVQLVEGNERRQLNLGIYWGDSPSASIPVLLAGTLTGNQLDLKVENRTTDIATGGLVEIVTPADLRIKPVIIASAGQTGYAAHRTRVTLADIAPGETATIGLELDPASEALLEDGQSAQSIQVFFTYAQQLTPQAIQLDASSLWPAVAAETPPPEGASSIGTAAETANTPATAPEFGQVAAPSPTEKIAPLPMTGAEDHPVNGVILVLAAIIVLGLGVSGWQSLKSKM